ncbi:MAG: ElyC/SanA/YdcF family protein [Fuerstiella sp.]
MSDILQPALRTCIFRVIGWMAVGLMSSGAAWFLAFGRTVTEKLVTALILPCGIIWLMLFGISLLAFFMKNRTIGICGLFTFAIFTVLGSGYVAGFLTSSLEGPFRDIKPFEQRPFDKVVLLGGGGKLGSNHRAQGSSSGDRLILAAAMYHGGMAKTVICTGTSIQGLGNGQLGPGKLSAIVLRSLGVPDDAIEFIDGRTTAEEMVSLRQHLTADDKRVGIVTSAWHLSRALRLAERQNLKLHPLPADFLGGPIRPKTSAEIIKDCIPEADSLLVTTHLLRERMAELAGR